MRLLFVFVLLAIVLLVPFLIWGDDLAVQFSREGAAEWLRSWGSWAWAAATVLLILDLFLPVPATAVMAALGLVYGTIVGGLIGAIGSCLSGLVAYTSCRLLGRPAAERIAGASDLERGERLFAAVGGWLVALSRWLPLFPEVIACMAGLTHMSRRTFVLALACGSVPMAFTFAAVGHAGAEYPVLSVVLSAVLPLFIWPAAQVMMRRRERTVTDDGSPRGDSSGAASSTPGPSGRDADDA